MKTQIKNNETNPIPEEVIAEAIIKVASAFKKADETKLKRNTIVILLQAKTGLSMKCINRVLDACLSLEQDFLKKPKV